MDGDGEPPSEHMALLKGGESATRCCDLVVGLLKIALYLILFLLLCLLVLKPVDMFICDIVQLDGWFIDVVMAVFLIMLDIVLLEGMRRLLDWLFTRFLFSIDWYDIEKPYTLIFILAVVSQQTCLMERIKDAGFD